MMRVKLKHSHLLDEASLSPKELSKVRGGKIRINTFIQAIQNDVQFTTNDGRAVTIKKEVIPRLEALRDSGDITNPENIQKSFGFRNIMLPSSLGIIKLSDLKKPKELGGEDSEKRVAKEFAARGQLQELIDQALEKSTKDSITIILQDKDGNVLQTINGVTGVDNQGKVGGVDPKADFVLIRKSGMPSVYISHKDGSNPQDFGQWSGVSPKAGSTIFTHPEVASFVEALKNSEYVKNGALVNGITVARRIQDPALQLLSIFGNQSVINNKISKEDGSPENVDIIAQGIFTLEQTDKPNVFILGATHMMIRKSFENDFGTGYTPILAARYTSDGRSNFGIKFARIGIYPEKGRKIGAFI